ncbi:hypothetical protein AB5N19_08177 [Seiridium cardinale]
MCRALITFHYALCGCTIHRWPEEDYGLVFCILRNDTVNFDHRQRGCDEGTFCRDVGDIREMHYICNGESNSDTDFTKDKTGICPRHRAAAALREARPDATDKEIRAAMHAEGNKYRISQHDKKCELEVLTSDAKKKSISLKRAVYINHNAERRIKKALISRPSSLVLEENPEIIINILAEIDSLPSFLDKPALVRQTGTLVAAKYKNQIERAKSFAAGLGFKKEFKDGLMNPWKGRVAGRA